ncbi:MAG TPA: tRNA (adenosine(37)-N6)-threonylcarbamoyltransferase complex ATPase subunit type 1 TsaE [Candidatus Saccharimonadales bacterium]
MAEQLGERLKGGEVIELVSDLGGGKTTFVRGLASGIGSNDTVSSPTFTLSNVYKGKDLTMYHFDFYRLAEPGIMREEIAEVLKDPQAVTIIEWADIVHDVLPEDRVTMHITATGETSRHYDITTSERLQYLTKDLV